MKIAKRMDWKIEDLPAQRTVISLDRSLEPHEMERVRCGLVPAQMEDKWFIFWEDDALYFHRSWTGFCIYAVYFKRDGDLYRIVSADVNRDPEQYKGVSDERDAELISYLVDTLLLRQSAAFPRSTHESGESALEKWSLVGRAALGEHPDDEWR